MPLMLPPSQPHVKTKTKTAHHQANDHGTNSRRGRPGHGGFLRARGCMIDKVARSFRGDRVQGQQATRVSLDADGARCCRGGDGRRGRGRALHELDHVGSGSCHRTAHATGNPALHRHEAAIYTAVDTVAKYGPLHAILISILAGRWRARRPHRGPARWVGCRRTRWSCGRCLS